MIDSDLVARLIVAGIVLLIALILAEVRAPGPAEKMTEAFKGEKWQD